MLCVCVENKMRSFQKLPFEMKECVYHELDPLAMICLYVSDPQLHAGLINVLSVKLQTSVLTKDTIRNIVRSTVQASQAAETGTSQDTATTAADTAATNPDTADTVANPDTATAVATNPDTVANPYFVLREVLWRLAYPTRFTGSVREDFARKVCLLNRASIYYIAMYVCSYRPRLAAPLINECLRQFILLMPTGSGNQLFPLSLSLSLSKLAQHDTYTFIVKIPSSSDRYWPCCTWANVRFFRCFRVTLPTITRTWSISRLALSRCKAR